METEKRARIGLIGAGWIGSEHARNLAANPRARLVAIADPKLELARALGESLGAHARPGAGGAPPRIYGDYQALLADEEVEAVYICSPNAMHAEMAIAAAEAGKHIMCEKPMAITLGDCRRIRDAVLARGVKYLIGYHRRFNPLFQYAKGLLDEGRLGEPVLAESDYIHHVPGDWAIWEWLGKEQIAGSIFHAGCGHNFDLLRFFCGELAAVSCFKSIAFPRMTQIETEDVALANLRFAGGALGRVTLLLGGINPFTFHFALHGTRGTVRNNRVWLDTMPRFAEPGHERDCIELPASWVPDNVQGGVAETWHGLDDHFVSMLLDGAPSMNDAESAWATSRAIFAALQSAAENRPIRIE